MLAPSVQVSGAGVVGAGVLIASHPIPGSDARATYALTAWHVVRDLFGDPGLVPDVELLVYTADGAAREEAAYLVEHDADLDVAILRLRSTACMDVARPASLARLSDMRVFAPVYAVGCPLGNDPIPTRGEVVQTLHMVDGKRYWMVSAPTYIGNSGGGIFDAETHELLGLFVKIYTHGVVRPQIVTHMGLATPLGDVLDWLEQAGFAGLVR